jgi:hypothetical protein
MIAIGKRVICRKENAYSFMMLVWSFDILEARLFRVTDMEWLESTYPRWVASGVAHAGCDTVCIPSCLAATTSRAIRKVSFYNEGMHGKTEFNRFANEDDFLGLWRTERFVHFKALSGGESEYYQGIVESIHYIVKCDTTDRDTDTGFLEQFPPCPFLPCFTDVDISAGKGQGSFLRVYVSSDDKYPVGYRKQDNGHRDGI